MRAIITKDPIKAKMLGRHRSLKSTQVYTHTSPEGLDEAMGVTFEGEWQISTGKAREAVALLRMLAHRSKIV